MRPNPVRESALWIGLGLAALVVLGALISAPSDDALARRLLLAHARACVPQDVVRTEDLLQISCVGADAVVFVQQPMCDESVLCAWGLQVTCWEPDRRPAGALGDPGQ